MQWFSHSKGYGFIRGKDGVERFFHVTDLAGGFIPDRGASVFFQSRQDGKGPRAASVRLATGSAAEGHRHSYRNGRMFYPHCGSSIVPRLIFNYGAPIYSIRFLSPGSSTQASLALAELRLTQMTWLRCSHPHCSSIVAGP
ncbi:MAG: hypothetical protein DM484_28110 [Candidatus Methylumidiphilus alinenensis]|uniref:CSD domain-containing protein n=1 Tax=Candidatus Methylumidiphilus alinenensis TaxID=2202197 RepID=A0A2W4SFX0_9GAMM|nr:MAG: hypothetical protein DM484_28110 [Candidatus Methylumidiphilus alinenensis]